MYATNPITNWFKLMMYMLSAQMSSDIMLNFYDFLAHVSHIILCKKWTKSLPFHVDASIKSNYTVKKVCVKVPSISERL